MGEVFLDAFLDTLKILPFLLVMNFLIEFVEYKTNGLSASKALKGGAAPFFGAAAGIVPQCGFSVVATELYSKRKIAVGTLMAVYLATSDEALPIMLSSYEGIKKLWPVLVIKFVFALVIGYAAFGIQKLTEKRTAVPIDNSAEQRGGDRAHDECHDGDGNVDGGHGHDHERQDERKIHIHGCHRHELEEREEILPEGATKKQKAKRVWDVYLKHPLVHTGTVILYIFIVNVIFGIIVYYVTEERLAAFIAGTGYYQPFLSALAGLVPNCAASVVITELYVIGGLNLGGCIAGLCVSAGIGYAVLVRENRPVKNTVFIIVIMYVISVALGVTITAFGY